jgi:Txe/YoeB family toxin of Txe-Axe toxin-antitoxin module
VHSHKKTANARAKKIIYDTGHCRVDVDKIIEELKGGLFTGIGVGGKVDGEEGSCYARKTQVERKMVDEDSEDEEVEDSVEIDGGSGGDESGDESGDQDGDVEMG